MSLRILSAGSTLHGLNACAELAARALGTDLVIATDHGHNILDAAKRGAANADVVLLPADMVDELAGKNLVRDPVALGAVGIGGVVRAGVHAPDISSMVALRVALVAADAVLLTRAPTGDNLLEVIARLGLRDEIGAKLLRFDTASKLNVHLAARKDRALGFSPETEIRAGEGVAWIGEVPAEIQIALPYAAAMVAGTAAPEAARRFLDFLRTPAAREAFARSGVRAAGSAPEG